MDTTGKTQQPAKLPPHVRTVIEMAIEALQTGDVEYAKELIEELVGARR